MQVNKTKIQNNKPIISHPLFLVLFHVGIGLLATAYRPSMLIYFIGVIAYFFIRILQSTNKQHEVLLAASYMMGAEVFFRMTKAVILYESGKYAVMLFLFLGLFFQGFKRKSVIYVIYLLLLIPGIYISYLDFTFGEQFRQMILFNLSGPLCLSIAAIYCYDRTVYFSDFLKYLNFIVYPLIAMTIYIFFYNIDVQSVITGTASTSATSGGYGPNQVATMLGLGMFILYSRFLIPYQNKLLHLIMMFFLIAMSYRAIITFSRGGVFVAVGMIAVFSISYFLYTSNKSKLKFSNKIIAILGAVLAIWSYAILSTGGLIANRYTNKDALGREKADITTGRAELLDADLSAFAESPIFGVGVGQIKGYYFETLNTAVASHNEVSRLLSEHGLFGILALLILLTFPFISKLQGRRNVYFLPLFIFWLLTILHSSMRIAAPAFVYGLCLLNLQYEKRGS